MTTPTQRKAAVGKLESLIKQPKVRTIDGNPAVRVKSGRLYEIIPPGRVYPVDYRVGIDSGLTCREVGVGQDVSGVLDLILAEEARRGA